APLICVWRSRMPSSVSSHTARSTSFAGGSGSSSSHWHHGPRLRLAICMSLSFHVCSAGHDMCAPLHPYPAPIPCTRPNPLCCRSFFLLFSSRVHRVHIKRGVNLQCVWVI